MTRSSRHKSSKHSSREARDYSDSEKEKDSSVKERKSKDDGGSVRVSKESGSGSEKRKFDSRESKDVIGSGNGDYSEEFSSSSKRRKERASDDGVSDRWNGGGEDERIESSRKSKGSSESKSKRRDDSEEPRSKGEGKHRESSRKESREADRERKVKEGKNERFVEIEKTESNVQDRLPSPDSENQIDRRVRKRRDSSGDGDKVDVDIGDGNDRRRDDLGSDGRLKDEKHKDERYRDKYREDVDRDSKHRDDKQRDERPGRDHTSNRSDDKHLKNEKDTAETRQKKSKLQEIDRDREREYDYDRDHGQERDFEPGRHRDRDRDHDHDRSHGRDRGHDCDGDREWDRERNREQERDRERNQEQERDRDRDRRDRNRDRDHGRERERERDRNRDRDRDIDHDRDRDLDNDGSHNDDGSFKYKDNRGRKRSPDDHDDFTDTKSRGIKAPYLDMENRSLGSRVDSDAERGRSQSRQAYVDSTVSSNRRRTSPSPSSQGGTDDYRHVKEDLKHRDSVAEQRPKGISSKEVSGFSGVSERGSRYRSTERAIKMEDGLLGELSAERSSSLKASPMGLMERSPSSTSLDRRYMNRNGSRRSLDIEETGRRSSVGPRELSANEDRLGRDLPLEKPLADESSQIDLLYYNRTSQSNSSSQLPPPSAFRAGLGSPSFMGSLEEDGRVNIGARYRRSVEPNIGRGQGNAWRGAPNWSSPLPNGFIPFQHGPPHGGYPAMMSQFPSPSIFGVRPPMEMNPSGIPYHIHDADRFAGHLRPLGWQNMMDGSGPPHLHGWDGNNGGFRDEPHMYGGADWDQHRHPMNGRGWETAPVDLWKGENGDVNMDLPSTSQKEDNPMQAPADDVLDGQESHQAQIENNNMVQDNSMATKPITSAKESSKSLPKTAYDEKCDPSKISGDNVARRCCTYLSKLDISVELAGPELYSQCMSLLDMNQTATVDKDTTLIVQLKDGGISVPKSSKALLNTPLFPAANDSVFQRAMIQYKKQRVQISGLQISNGGIEMISKSHPEKVEQESLCVAEKAGELVLTSDSETPNAPSSTADQKKSEPVLHADVQGMLEELASTPSQAVQDLIPGPLPDMQVSELNSNPKSSEEPVPVFRKDNKMDGMTVEQVILEESNRDHSPSLDNASEAATVLPTDGDNVGQISKTKGNNSDSPAKERQPFADEYCGPLLFNDGSPIVSGAVIPGSNESESVILSRIHHSPESTH